MATVCNVQFRVVSGHDLPKTGEGPKPRKAAWCEPLQLAPVPQQPGGSREICKVFQDYQGRVRDTSEARGESTVASA